MSNENYPEPGKKDPIIAIIWLFVGLAPTVVLLTIVSSPSPHGGVGVVLIGCAICNLLGGFGCLRGVKNTGTRIAFGILLSGFFFVLSWGVALLQACSHMNI